MSNSIPMLGKLKLRSKFTLIYQQEFGFDKIVHLDQFVCLKSLILWGPFQLQIGSEVAFRKKETSQPNLSQDKEQNNLLKIFSDWLHSRFLTPQNVPIITCVWIGFFITSFIIFIGKQQSNICVFLFFKNPNNIQKCVSVL